MLLVNYAPSGAIRGLWVGPYFAQVFGRMLPRRSAP
jgi:hypothetical protein